MIYILKTKIYLVVNKDVNKWKNAMFLDVWTEYSEKIIYLKLLHILL